MNSENQYKAKEINIRKTGLIIIVIYCIMYNLNNIFVNTSFSLKMKICLF